MRRVICAILLFALLGVATSMGVAWIVAARLPDWKAGESYTSMTFYAGWVVREWSERGRVARSGKWLGEERIEDEYSYSYRYFAQEPDPRSRHALTPGNDDVREYFEMTTGWPLPSWRWEIVVDPTIGEYRVLGGIDAPGFGMQRTQGMPIFLGHRVLPLVPAVPQIVGDGLFWACSWAALGAVVVGGTAARRRWRRRRRLCIRCKYDLRGADHARCPECGWNVRAQTPIVNGRHFALLAIAATAVSLALVAAGAAAVSMRGGPEPIHRAARDGNLNELRRLLARGVDVDEPITHGTYGYLRGYTPLMIAARHDQLEAVRFLLEHGADVDGPRSSSSALKWAVTHRRVETVALLLERGADPNRHGSLYDGSLLHIACTGDWADDRIVTLLIEHGAKVDALAGKPGRTRTPLNAALSDGHARIADLLLKAPADLHAGTISPLGSAMRGGPEALRWLIDAGFDLADASGFAVELAAQQHDGALEMVRILLDHGLIVDWSGPFATGALYNAVRRLNLDLYDELIARGADPLLLTRDSGTLLFAPSNWGADQEWRRRLLPLGIDVNHRTERGYTALAVHIPSLHADTVGALLEAGADPTLTDSVASTSRDWLLEASPKFRTTAEWQAAVERILDLLDAAAGSPDETDRSQ